ncbi:MAG TPA: TonB-dependent receptor [Longimicrobiaceae bacterium]|nr:TonB-dependent receptor [Longimicrobiaceae bacterium]
MKSYIAVPLLLLAAATAHAQTGRPGGAPTAGAPAAAASQAPGEIHGVVRDGAGAPLGAASIAVRRSADSTLVTGGVTRADGVFRIEGLRPGAYYLRVSRLGFSTATVAHANVTAAQPSVDVGVVRLAAGAVALEGITASAQRSSPTVSSSPDRTVVSTRDMPTTTGGTATDVLRNVPGVDVDANGNVSLRGNGNVAIQINGRPSTLSADALANFLKQLPADLVSRVEVVPNPSARYDPDGMGGIVNVVLKQNTDLGTSGGVTAGGGTGERYNASGNLASQKGPLTLFGSYGYSHEVRSDYGFSLREQHLDGTPRSFLDQDTEGDNGRTSHTLNGSAELKLGARDVLSTTAMYNHGVESGANASVFRALDAARTLTGAYLQNTGVHEVQNNADATLGYKHSFAPRDHELTAGLDLNRAAEDVTNAFASVPGAPAPATLLGDSRNLLGQVVRRGELTVDFTAPWAGMQLETGYKGTLRRQDNELTTDSLFGGTPDPALRRTNAFRYDERVNAAYALLTRPAGSRLTLQGGLRVEMAATTFRLADSARVYPNDYNSLFPSAAATYRLSGSDQLHASYSKRIQRPRVWQINPFPEAQDQYNVRVGNPALRPEYTHSFEGSYQRAVSFGSASISPFYRHTVDAVRRIRTLDSTGVSVATFLNVASSDSWGTDLNGQFRVGERFSAMLGTSLFKVVTDGSYSGTDLSSSAFGWSARGSVNLKLGSGTDVQLSESYRAATEVPLGRQGAFNMANLGIRQKINDQAFVNVRVSDPFHTMRMWSESYDPGFTQLSERRFNSRAVYVNFSYNFGRAPRIKQPARNEEPQTPQGEP